MKAKPAPHLPFLSDSSRSASTTATASWSGNGAGLAQALVLIGTSSLPANGDQTASRRAPTSAGRPVSDGARRW
jgi:hypothetical protein